MRLSGSYGQLRGATHLTTRHAATPSFQAASSAAARTSLAAGWALSAGSKSRLRPAEPCLPPKSRSSKDMPTRRREAAAGDLDANTGQEGNITRYDMHALRHTGRRIH